MQPSAPPRSPVPKPGRRPPGSVPPPGPPCAVAAPAAPLLGWPPGGCGEANTAPGMLIEGTSEEAGCWLLCNTKVCDVAVCGVALVMLLDGTDFGGPGSGAGIGGASWLGWIEGFGAGD